MNKPVEIVFLKEAEIFHQKLPKNLKQKFTIDFYKTKNGYKGPWFSKIKNSNGIFEFREKGIDKFFRLFAFWDNTGKQETLIVCSHGIEKKSNKTSRKEIEKAERIMKKYFNEK